MADLKDEIKDAKEKLEKKRDTLKKLNKVRHEFIDKLGKAAETPEAQGDVLKKLEDQSHSNEVAIEDLIKNIHEEVSTLDGMIRKYRFIDYAEPWNLWVGGFIAALVVDTFDILVEVIKKLLGKLTDPDEIEKLLEKLLENVDKILK